MLRKIPESEFLAFITTTSKSLLIDSIFVLESSNVKLAIVM